MKDQIYGVIGSFTVKRSRGKGGGRIRRIHEFAGMFELEIKSKAGIQYKSIKVRLGDAFGYSHGHGKMYGETITFKKEYNDRNKGDEQYQYELTKIGDKTWTGTWRCQGRKGSVECMVLDAPLNKSALRIFELFVEGVKEETP